jgi:hypothetical protein
MKGDIHEMMKLAKKLEILKGVMSITFLQGRLLNLRIMLFS